MAPECSHVLCAIIQCKLVAVDGHPRPCLVFNVAYYSNMIKMTVRAYNNFNGESHLVDNPDYSVRLVSRVDNNGLFGRIVCNNNTIGLKWPHSNSFNYHNLFSAPPVFYFFYYIPQFFTFYHIRCCSIYSSAKNHSCAQVCCLAQTMSAQSP